MKRPLRPDELRLWAKVAGTMRPAPGRTLAVPPPPPAVVAPAPACPPAGKARPHPVDLAALKAFADREPVAARPRAASHVSPALDLDPRRRRRIVRERDPIEARLDLHGLDQDQARAALERFVRQAHAEGARAVLVITGKGGGRSEGVLRRFAPEWLRAPALRPLIAGVSEADRRHGGAGALYVALKGRPA